jgi:DNA-directed RNA polymerase specialized sigma24 family protein
MEGAQPFLWCGGRSDATNSRGQCPAKATVKHGGQHLRQSLDDSEFAMAAPADEVLAVHEALDRLAGEDRVASELVKLHYFGGFSLEEAADLVGISRASAYRTWTYARTWLRAALQVGTDSSYGA